MSLASLNSLIIVAKIYLEKVCAYILVGIGACRAVWVPGQDLAMPHLMRNCEKHILSLHCMLYIRLCVRKHAHAIYEVFTSGARDMSMHNLK